MAVAHRCAPTQSGRFECGRKKGALGAPFFCFTRDGTQAYGESAPAVTVSPVASTLLTPLTLCATWIARFLSMLLATVPVSRTMPSWVSTEILLAGISDVVANSDF